MHPTEIRLGQHLGRHFRAHWIIMSNRKVKTLDVVSLAEEKGIHLFDPEEILTPTVKYDPFVEFPKVEKPQIPLLEPCFIFTNTFRPIENFKQTQLLTNSIIKDELPAKILDRVEGVSTKEEKLLRECILYSMALDSRQDKLPRHIDVHNRPGIVLPRVYGIPNSRKNESLNHKLHILLLKCGIGEPRGFAEDITSTTTLNHSGRLIRMRHNAKFLLCTNKPLLPIASKEEVIATSDVEMPSIYPFNPFINCWERTSYETGIDRFGVRGKAPHTVFVHENDFIKRGNAEKFSSKTMIHAFSHAAAYAREIYKDIEGDLPSPVTLQIVHTNGRDFHMGVFQLNTLDMNGPVKNIFWHQPQDKLYESCDFYCGAPDLVGLNSKPYSILKAFYSHI